MLDRSVQEITSFEQHNFDFDPNSWVRLIDNRFSEDTSVLNIHEPGLYISMIGQCRCKSLNKEGEKEQDIQHQYIVALVEEAIPSRMLFFGDSTWQTCTIMLSLNHLRKNNVMEMLRPDTFRSIPGISLADIGPIPVDILRCCEALWSCTFKGFERELFIKAKAQEVLALFLHQHRQKGQIASGSRIEQLSNALNHIQTNLNQEWPLSDVARLAGSNRTYVKQDIKTLLGMNFRDWLKKTRLESAQAMLATDEPITEIAHNVGFRSQAHFATLFKSELGLTPSEYRQSLTMRSSA